jgi:hypothetical protein
VFPALGKVQFTTKNGNNIEIEPVGKQIPNIIENENRYCLNIDFFIRINETIDVLQILLGFDEELQMFVSISAGLSHAEYQKEVMDVYQYHLINLSGFIEEDDRIAELFNNALCETGRIEETNTENQIINQ